MKTELYSLEGKARGTLEVPEALFAMPWKPALVHQVLSAEQANARRPWAHAKDRSEVRGGGRKPWRQKGTGRARHGSIRSPLWVGGGKAHGPRKERIYSEKVNRKMRKLAFVSVLSRKLKDSAVKIFDTLEVASPKTNSLAALLRPLLGVSNKMKRFDVLLVRTRENKNLARAGRNLVKVKVAPPGEVTLNDLVNYHHLFIDQSVIPELEHRAALRR